MKSDFDRYLGHLSEFDFIRSPRIRPCSESKESSAPDACLEMLVGGRKRVFSVELQKTNPASRSAIDHWIARRNKSSRDWILFASHIGRELGRYLQSQHVNFLDLSGNCHLWFDANHIAIVEGRRRETPLWESGGTGKAGYKVIFALLVRPELVDRPVREIATESQASKTSVASTLSRLERDGIVGRSVNKLVLLKPGELLRRWVVGYSDTIRPSLIMGQYRSKEDDSHALDRAFDEMLSVPLVGQVENVSLQWAWGGTAAAYRLTGYYRGTTTVLHFSEAPSKQLTQQLRLQEQREGSITFLGVPGPLAFTRSDDNIAHPVLVYSELLASRDERARDAAFQLRERYLGHLA